MSKNTSTTNRNFISS